MHVWNWEGGEKGSPKCNQHLGVRPAACGIHRRCGIRSAAQLISSTPLQRLRMGMVPTALLLGFMLVA